MLKKAGLLIRSTLAGRGAPCPKQSRSKRGGDEVHTSLPLARSPIKWIVAIGKCPVFIPTSESLLRYGEPLGEARTPQRCVLRTLLARSRGIHTYCSRILALFSVPFLVANLAACGGAPKPVYFPGYPVGFVERGVASWYGPGFHGNKTANGERYDMNQLTAAHRTLPLGSIAVVRSMSTGRQVTVRINDRGPFARGRILDLSLAGAQVLGMTGAGTEQIELRVVGYQGRTADMGALRVQVGSFSDQQNAINLLERVKHIYSGGRVQAVDLPEGKRYRVQIGQFSSETQAEAAVSHLESSLGLQVVVFRDDP